MMALVGGAETQMDIRRVRYPADFATHEGGEELIDKLEKRLATAEIVRQRNACPSPALLTPQCFVFAEDFWVREAEPVDTLLDVAYQKTIGLCPLSAECGDDRILDPVDVLALVNEDEAQPISPLPGNGRIAQETKGKLLEIGKIDPA